MRIKGRLKKIYDFLDKSEEHYYDLFCDHGLLGSALLELEDTRVSFNDKRPHLIEDLKARLSNNARAEFYTLEAQDMVFEHNSTILMAGVGGLTMISCFKRWMNSMSPEHFDSLKFVVSPHYYGFDLRHYLIEEGFAYNAQSLIKDGRYIYEIAYVSRQQGQRGHLVDKNLWKSFGELGKEYLSFSVKNYSRKQTLEPWERQLLADIRQVIQEA